MYLSVRDGLVTHAGFPTVNAGLKALGVKAVEVGLDRDMSVMSPASGERIVMAKEAGVNRLRDELAQVGAKGSAFLLPTDFNRGDGEAEIEWHVGALRAAEALGMKAIRIDAHMTGQDRLPLDERVGIFAAAVKEVIKRTADCPAAMGIENHGMQGNDPNFLRRLFDAVGSERLGLTLDSGNFYWAGHPLDRVYEIMEELAGRAKHTHLKNIRYPAEMRNQQRPLGYEYGKYVAPMYEGDIDHARVFKILAAAGYDGDLCLEDESLGHYQGEERLEVVRKDIEHMAECLAAAQGK